MKRRTLATPVSPRAARAHSGRKAHKAQLQALIERVGLINRIHSALRSTLNPRDLYAIVLTHLISHSAFDFSRAILLTPDEASGAFRVEAALGASTREEHLQLRREIAEEEAHVASMVTDLRKLEPEGQEETLFGRTLRELSHHSFWITAYQKYSAQSAFASALQGLTLTPPSDALRAGARASRPRFWDQLLHGDQALIVTRAELRAAELPADFVKALPGRTLWGAVKTQRGVRLLVVVDRVFGSEPLDRLDLLHVDWFLGQVALALENAEMFKANETAYLELRELDRMKSNFLSTVSHELRTPLTAITGYVQLLLGHRIGSITPAQKEVLERILVHSELLTGKVNDLIEIAEMDAGRMRKLELAPIDPLNVLMSVLPRLEAQRARRNVMIEPELCERIPPIRSNPEALARIYFHLIDNAVKFSHPGGQVRIRFEPTASELRIAVIDHGIGIDPDHVQRIFDLFFQVDSQLTRSYEGLGIGLTVIKKYLDATGGRIEVQSEPSVGSTFTVIYPLA